MTPCPVCNYADGTHSAGCCATRALREELEALESELCRAVAALGAQSALVVGQRAAYSAVAGELRAILDRHAQDSTPSGSAGPHNRNERDLPAQSGGGTTSLACLECHGRRAFDLHHVDCNAVGGECTCNPGLQACETCDGTGVDPIYDPENQPGGGTTTEE